MSRVVTTLADVSDVLPEIGLVVVLVLLNAAFAGSEMALVSLRESQLQRLEATGRRGRALAALARDPNRFLATIQIGITLAGFLASAAAAVALAEPLVPRLEDVLGGAAEAVAIIGVTIVLSYVTLVFGELTPKRIAMQRAEGWGLLAARPLTFVARLTRPAVWVLSRSTDVVVRLLGGDPTRQGEDVSDEDLRQMVSAQPGLTEQHRQILAEAFQIAERTLFEIVQPRVDVFSLPAAMPCGEALGELARSGHSRAPVTTDGNLDDVLGVVHLRDLVDEPDRTVGDVTHAAVAFPETAKVLDALRTMQQEHHQLAVVVDEHGGIDGIVTVEDLLEELVGEIYDETDRDIMDVQVEADGVRLLPGRFPVHDLPDIDVHVPSGQYSTVAGLVLDRLGFIPEGIGDCVRVGGFVWEVAGVDGRVITDVRLRPDPTATVAEHDDEEPGHQE